LILFVGYPLCGYNCKDKTMSATKGQCVGVLLALLVAICCCLHGSLSFLVLDGSSAALKSSPSFPRPTAVLYAKNVEAVALESDIDLQLDQESGHIVSLLVTDQSDPVTSGAASFLTNSDDLPHQREDVRAEEVAEVREVKGLPMPGTDSESSSGATRSFAMGETLSLEDLGPMVVQTDGTVRRITNWETMTKQEQDSTMRVITARNRKRLAALKETTSRDEPAAASTTHADL
jgi:hypothetical protein